MMEIVLTPEQEDRLIQMAEQEGKTPSQFVVDAMSYLGYRDDPFREIVQQRVSEADAGVFVEEEEMDARFEQMLKG